MSAYKSPITNSDDKALAALFDEWRDDLLPNEKAIADKAVKTLCEKIHNMGEQSAKCAVAHALVRMK